MRKPACRTDASRFNAQRRGNTSSGLSLKVSEGDCAAGAERSGMESLHDGRPDAQPWICLDEFIVPLHLSCCSLMPAVVEECATAC